MKGNKKLLLIGLPVAVVLPLLAASFIIGPQSIWLWAGVGIGMAITAWANKQRKGATSEKATK